MIARIGALSLLLCEIALSAIPQCEAAEPLKIRIGSVSIAANLPSLVFFKPEIMRHFGKSYTVEALHFSGTSQEFTALAAGEVEFVTIAYSSLGAAVLNAHLDDIRIVIDGFQDGAEGYLSTPYMVRRDSFIKTIEDLKGKIAVVNEIGAAVDIGMRVVLRAHHLEANKDYTIVEAPFPVMAAMLLERKVDLAAETTPFLYDPRLEQGARTLFSMKDGMGRSQMIAMAARAGFLAENRGAVEDFFDDLVHGLHWMLDPANRMEVIALVAQVTKMPASQLEDWYLSGRDYYHDRDGVPNLAALQSNIDEQGRLGFLKSGIDVKKYADLSFIEAAASKNAAR